MTILMCRIYTMGTGISVLVTGSNPRPHQKTMHRDLSRLVGPSALLRQYSNARSSGRFAFGIAASVLRHH
jgi:hypothetical protein